MTVPERHTRTKRDRMRYEVPRFALTRVELPDHRVGHSDRAAHGFDLVIIVEDVRIEPRGAVLHGGRFDHVFGPQPKRHSKQDEQLLEARRRPWYTCQNYLVQYVTLHPA